MGMALDISWAAWPGRARRTYRHHRFVPVPRRAPAAPPSTWPRSPAPGRHLLLLYSVVESRQRDMRLEEIGGSPHRGFEFPLGVVELPLGEVNEAI